MAADGPGREAARAIADDLERLGVAAAAIPGPVAGRRGDQPGFEVVAYAGLGTERVDGLQLAADVIIDSHEVGRPVVNGGRGRLEAVDPAHPPGGDHGRAVGVGMILVDVVNGVRVDDCRLDFRDDLLMTPMVGLPSGMRVSCRSSRNSRAPMTSAACCDSRARRTWSPPCAPRERVKIATVSPAALWASSVPAAPISTSSGCAPMARTVSRPAARAARPASTSSVALATRFSAVMGFCRNSAAELRSAETA